MIFYMSFKAEKLIYGIENQNRGCLWGSGLTGNRYEGTFRGNGDV